MRLASVVIAATVLLGLSASMAQAHGGRHHLHGHGHHHGHHHKRH